MRADISCGLQEDKLVTVSSVVAPPQFARWQNVGGGSSVAALTFKSVILAATLYEGEQRVPLLWWQQGLRGHKVDTEILDTLQELKPVLPESICVINNAHLYMEER